MLTTIKSIYENGEIKVGNLALDKSLRAYIDDSKAHNFSILPISENHVISYDAVPLFESHRDPFVRLIIATAMFNDLAIATADK